MNRRRFSSLAIGIAPAFALEGCARGKKGPPIAIALVAKAMDSEFRQSLRARAQAAGGHRYHRGDQGERERLPALTAQPALPDGRQRGA